MCLNLIRNALSAMPEGWSLKIKTEENRLSLCKKYVEAHGGRIEVESEVGKGTKFIVKLLLSKI